MQTETEKSETQSLENHLTKPVKFYQDIIWQLCQEQYPGLVEMAKILYKRTKYDYDNHVSIEGQTGSGKSMFTFILVHLMHHLNGTSFNIKKHCLFIPDDRELKKSLTELDAGLPYWIDEAIRALDKHFWYKLESIQLNHYAKTERWKCNTILYNMQRFSEFTESFRNSNIQFRFVVISRYAIVMRIKDEDADVEDPWHTKKCLTEKYTNKYGITKYQIIQTPAERLIKERKVPNYIMDERFPNISDNPDLQEYWNHYQFLKEQSRIDEKEKALDRLEAADCEIKYRHKQAIIGIIKQWQIVNPDKDFRFFYRPVKPFCVLSSRSFEECWQAARRELRDGLITVKDAKEKIEKAVPIPEPIPIPIPEPIGCKVTIREVVSPDASLMVRE